MRNHPVEPAPWAIARSRFPRDRFHQASSNSSFWWRTSLTRRDTEQGACEALFVTEIEVVARATPGWHWAYRVGGRALALMLLGKVLLFVSGIFARSGSDGRAR